MLDNMASLGAILMPAESRTLADYSMAAKTP
jgi:hypothetical protein